NEPAAVDQVEFRRPDIIGVAAACRGGPDANARVECDAGDRARAADVNVTAIPGFAVVVKPAVENHPRIGRMGWQDRINSFARLTVYILLKRGRHAAPASLERI